jgi:hypothetical protein
MIGFIYEIDASEALMARNTIREIIALSTIITVLTPKKRVAIVGIANLVTVFAFMDKRTIQAVF